MQDQCRSLYVPGVLERRAVPVHIELLKYIAIKVALMSVGSIARPIVADEVHNTSKRHRGFEHVCVAYDPVSHVTAVAAAGHPQPVPIDPRILLQYRIHAAHHVLVVFAAPFSYDSPLELLAVARRASRVGKEHSPASRGIHLKLLEPIDAVHPRGSAVHTKDQRVFLSFLPS